MLLIHVILFNQSNIILTGLSSRNKINFFYIFSTK